MAFTGIPRYPAYSLRQQGWYAPWQPTGLFASVDDGVVDGGLTAEMIIFFTPLDETKSFVWPYPSVPEINVYVYNQNTGQPEMGGTAVATDSAYPNSTTYTYYNSAGAGYIVAFGPKDPASIVDAPANIPVSFKGGALPDATAGVPYDALIPVYGTTPITVTPIDIPAWMTVTIIGSAIHFTGTPTAAATGVTVSIEADNDYGDPAPFIDTIDVLDEVPVSFDAGQLLPDATVDVAYSASITVNGSLPITVNVLAKPAWMTITIDGNTIHFTGTPTATASSITVSVEADNDFGAPVSFTDTIDVVDEVVIPPGDPKFGAVLINTQSVDDKLTVIQDLLELDYFRGGHEGVKDYHGQGSGNYTKLKARGMHYCLNCNWNTSSGGGQFAHDEALYKSQLTRILNDYADDTSVVEFIVIENEPTNQHYYADSMQNYLAMLGWAIEVIHAHGQRVVDGCTHVPAILGVKSGNFGGINGLVDQILTGINNLRLAGKVLDFCNMHTAVTDTSPSAGQVAAAAQYVRQRTGIPNIIMNEFAHHTSNPARAAAMIAQTREANLKYAIPLGSQCPSDGHDYPFNCNLSLTPLGQGLHDAIHLIA